ncbi:MAG: hypothetical protein NC123_16435 [Butyrivibrio sp.]|nr:hypothetical protein [Acetatifactor muris]MCM1561107.1 hypothetical protein [Butyrivibrio sp.]
MAHIGGNTKGWVQVKSVEPDEYALDRTVWRNAFQKPLTGVLDLTGADVSHKLMKRVEDAEYIFLCDYTDLTVDGKKLNTENSRMLIDGQIYEVLLYDDPMQLHEHLEIYLKYVGGQEDGG